MKWLTRCLAIGFLMPLPVIALAMPDGGSCDGGACVSAPLAPLSGILTDVLASIGPILAAAASQNWMVLAATLLILCVSLTRKYLGPRVSWFKSDAGAITLTAATSMAGALGTAMMTGRSLDVSLLLDMLKITFGAMGGYAAIKKLLGPLLASLIERVTNRPGAQAAELQSELKGGEAVDKQPGGGAADVVGKGEELK